MWAAWPAQQLQKERPAKHHDHSGQHPRRLAQGPLARPKIGEQPEQEGVQRQDGVDRAVWGQEQVEPVDRIEYGNLRFGEKGHAAERIGIVKHDVPVREFLEGQYAPGQLPP